MRLIGKLILLLWGFSWLGQAAGEQAATLSGFHSSPDELTNSVTYRLQLPRDDYRLMVYSDGTRPVFHIESKNGERLVDGFSGQPWTGDLGTLMQDYRLIETIDPRERLPRGAPETLAKHLETTGCSRHNFLCTTLSDADFVVFASVSPNFNEFSIEIHDYTRLFQQMHSVLAGVSDTDERLFTDRQALAALAYAGRFPWRERFIDALRSINDPAHLRRLVENLNRHPKFASLPFVGEDFKLTQASGKITDQRFFRVDLTRELNIAACRVRAISATQAVFEDKSESQRGLSGLVSDCSDYAIFVNAAFRETAGSESGKLASILRRTAGQSTGKTGADLLAYACWLDGQACGPARGNPSIAKASPGSQPKRSAQGETPAAPEPASASAGRNPPAANSAPMELSRILELGNKLLLLGFDEVGAGLKRDPPDLGGLVFVARPVAGAKDGRFVIEAFPNPRSPVKLSEGDYRVRVKLSIDFLREDQCAKGISCFFQRPRQLPKTVPVDSVFYIGRYNHWRDKQEVSVGSLVPLVADGTTRYTSTLKEVRLAVHNISSFEPH